MLEFNVGENSKVIGKELKDIDFPSESIVGVCLRDGELIIPRGDFTPRVNDHLIVFTLPVAVRKVEKILG